MFARLQALAVLAALILITYLVEYYHQEVRMFLLHAMVVLMIETGAYMVSFGWPPGNE